jgi:MFS transporter, FSR family, fosmidomycin resistance protein
MNAATFRLVLLISCAHAMVHVYELSLPSVEQFIRAEYSVDKTVTGPMGTVWRLPFGFGALLAGWLADRFGCKPMLIVYLLGCVATSFLAWWAPSLAMLFAVMFAMGCFASIYHPAGLAIISRETTPEHRSAALGWHGIFGSIGIAAAPAIAGVMLTTSQEFTWRHYYLVLMLPGAMLAAALWLVLRERKAAPPPTAGGSGGGSSAVVIEEPMPWRNYFIVVTIGAMAGFVYAALMNFLPDYLTRSEVPSVVAGATRMLGGSGRVLTPEELGRYGATIVLLVGAVGQGVAGKIARPQRLAPLLCLIMVGNAACLIWMATATGSMRLWAACAMGLVHFMNQPIYNSLIAQFVPFHRRSVGYGFSNMMCFGIGALGPTYAGFMPSDYANYASLSLVALAAAGLAAVLARRITSL